MEKNPNVKPGDKVLLLKARNSSQMYVGQELTVSIVNNGGGFITALTQGGMMINLFQTPPSDEYCLATKENHIKYLENKQIEIKEELESIEKKLDFYNKYESQEEFVADKLTQLMAANEAGETKEEKIKLMTTVLKTLKESNLI